MRQAAGGARQARGPGGTDEAALRADVVATARDLDRAGLNRGTSGNVSVRVPDGLLITPSGVPTAAMEPADVVRLDMDGTPHGALAPSSEWRFHRDILAARPDIAAVVHAHPPHATAIAITGQAIPAVHYMIAAAGGPTIRCAPYRTFGTEALSEVAVEALEDRLACLLANHGMIACGPSLARALWLAVEVETLAQQFVLSRIAGTPVVLDEEEIARVVDRFRTYGPRAVPAAAGEGGDPD